MKKLFLVSVLMLSSIVSFAQGEIGSVQFTPSVGFSMANITNSEADMKLGLVLGAEVQYQVTDVIALSGGLLFAQQGCKAKESGVTTKLNNNYLNIPLLVNAYVAKGLALKLGVQPGILLSAKAAAEADGANASFDVKNAYKTVDLSIPLGISYNINKIVFDFRYNLGITNLLKDTSSSENGKNSVFQLTLGYRF